VDRREAILHDPTPMKKGGRAMEEVKVNASDLDWEPANGYPGETTWKVLRRDADNHPATVLLKLPAGFEIESHSHVNVEHHYVLEGAYESMGTQYPAGSYRMIPPHTKHGPFRSETGALVLVLW
jgi:anti-sigma factor ChrR (cupin superfamily)